DNDLIGRAVMTRRLGELINASKPNPQAPPPDPAGMVEVIVPPGGAGCVQSLTIPRKYYYATVKDDRTLIAMPWPEFHALMTGHANGPGPNGATWACANPHLVDRLPKNPAPPPAAPLQ